jgi:putative oxidoreductase
MTINIPPDIEKLGVRVAQVLIAVVFLMNAFGVIDQSVPVKEMIARGVPAAVAPIAGWAGRIVELVAGVALVLGWRQRLAAIALVAFIMPATLVAHPFWLYSGTALLQPQLVNACKNLAIIGGLLFIASTRGRAEQLTESVERHLEASASRDAGRSGAILG